MDATAKEKQYEKEIYNMIMYLIVCVLFFNSLYFYLKLLYHPSNHLLNQFSTFMDRHRSYFESDLPIYIIMVLCVFLAMSSVPKLNPKASKTKGNVLVTLGTTMLASSTIFPLKPSWPHLLGYLSIQIIGVVLLILGGLEFSSIVHIPEVDIFNEENEQFPQNEKLLINPYSVNYKLQYLFKNEWREGYINVINPQRAVLVLGSQGSGKTFTTLIPAIWQSIYKGYTALVYDIKYPDLSIEAYNALYKALQNDQFAFGRTNDGKPIIPKFGVINFDQVYSRSNPLDEKYVDSIEAANETAKVLMLNLNKTWIKKEGDFFADSAINYVTLSIWYLRLMERKYAKQLQGRILCTLPHCIELIASNYKEVFNSMGKYQELGAYIAMFKVAMESKAADQLAGQVASAQNALARLSSPKIYWVMSGNDIDLDINNPESPKILCLANNPEKVIIYSAALSVYTATIMRLIYRFKKKGLKSGFFIDELPSLYLRGLDNFIATVRSYNVATWLGIQDMEQLTKDYGKEQANVIVNTCGTIFSGSVNNQTAETLSKMFGQTNQDSFSASYQKADISVSESTRMQNLVPASKITTLSQGNFVGKVADNFGEEIQQKLFKGFIPVETEELKKEFKEIPTPTVSDEEINENFIQIKEDIKQLLAWEDQEGLV
ncbi:type IV secretory system conjugative DNA transfer family protein [Runella limosa]|uniref:type IV secretory system conjugative DNA transfer family protein n=1 Tax=Runella limosa TaxID=370978 RepID=UPI00048AE82A|nr:type IV secretory system conjugative DNA transfer family protein [Runella limosa]